MPTRLSWSHLLPGLVALAVILLLAGGVLMFAGVGRVRGEKMRLYVLTNQARGVMRGSQVWVGGQKVGTVEGIDFRAPSNDSSGRLVIAIGVRKRDAAQIRRDSRVQVRAGANIIGPIVVYLDAGSAQSPAVKSGDTLRGVAQSDLEVAGTKLNAATEDVGPTLADARKIVARVHDRSGTIGAVMTEGLGGNVTSLRRRITRIRSQFAERTSATRGPPLMARASAAMARVDSVRTLLASPQVAFGRFRRDSTLMKTVEDLRDELEEVRAALANEDGTVGRFKIDSALVRSLASARTEMSELFADMRRRPLRYVNF